jgi:RNA polymerase sigma factor (sigma-70 family)
LQSVATQAASTVQPLNEQVFNDLLVPLVQPGYRLACSLLHDSQLAEDVVQEASLIAWRKLGKLNDRSRVRAWFLGIVANECRNTRRNRWWRAVTFGLSPKLSIASGEERWVRDADVRESLRRLSYEDRLVLSLYFYLDMPVEDVASVVGSSVDATRKRLYRAVHRLRPDLAIEEVLR